MKNRAHFIPFAALCLCAFPFSGLAAAQGEASSAPLPATVRVAAIVEASAAGSSFQSPQFSKNYTLAKATASDTLYVYKLTLDLTDGVSWPLSVQAAWVSSMP